MSLETGMYDFETIAIPSFVSHFLFMIRAGQVSTIAGSTVGNLGGTLLSAKFNSPTGVAALSATVLLVADSNNFCVRRVDLSANLVTTFAGQCGSTGSADGNQLSVATLGTPSFIRVDSSIAYVTESNKERIRQISTGASFAVRLFSKWRCHPRLMVASTSFFYAQLLAYAGQVVTLAGSGAVAGHTDGDALTAAVFNMVRASVPAQRFAVCLLTNFRN